MWYCQQRRSVRSFFQLNFYPGPRVTTSHCGSIALTDYIVYRAKRWARLMKARGLPPSASLMDPAGSKGTAANSDSQLLSSSPAPKAKPPVAKKTAAPKKRKASESDAEDHGSHDEPKAAPKKRARKQPAKKSAKKATVETEDEGEGSLDGYDGSFDATDPLSKTKV